MRPGGRYQVRYRLSPNVVYRDLDDETILLEVSAGQYYLLNETAQFALARLLEDEDENVISESLTERFDVGLEQARGDVASLIREMVSFGVIAPCAEPD